MLTSISSVQESRSEAGDARTAPADFIQIWRADPLALQAELGAGLSAVPARVAPKYLYDALGSKLFGAICELDEYYPTRTEAAILRNHLASIAAATGSGATLIDLGAGDCAKAARLFSALQPAQYVPVDISVDFLRDAVESLRYKFPQLEIKALGMDFSAHLALPPDVNAGRRLFFYPGSSIGNFAPSEALTFLRQVHAACRQDDEKDGGLLIGVDLMKDIATMEAAYDDALGVTAAFNLNILRHLNRLLQADFHLPEWRHRAFFNREASRIEMHLEARTDLVVRWEGGRRHFERGERIHTENSYKYTPKAFLALLEQAGFGAIRTWTDARDWFMVCHARAM